MRSLTAILVAIGLFIALALPAAADFRGPIRQLPDDDYETITQQCRKSGYTGAVMRGNYVICYGGGRR